VATDRAHIEQLLREGIAAAKGGKRASAQEILREVVALDEHNEKGWLWLASVVDSDEERRVCLSNVLVVNPGNQKAQAELNAIERRAALGNIAVASKPGSSRGALLVVIGVIILVLGIGAVLIGVLNNRTSNLPIPTAGNIAAGVETLVSTAVAGSPTTAGTAASTTTSPTTATLDNSSATASRGPGPTAAAVVPTAAVTSTAPPKATSTIAQPANLGTVPPTWTPLPTFTSAVKPSGTPLAAPPSTLPGRIVGVSGPILTLDGLLPVYVMKPDGSERKQITEDPFRGDFAILTPDNKIIYMYLAGGTGSRLLRYTNLNGTQPRIISEAWGGQPPLDSQRMPSIAANGRIMAFAAQNILANEQFSAIYVVDLSRFLNLSNGALPTGTSEPVGTLPATTEPIAEQTAPPRTTPRGTRVPPTPVPPTRTPAPTITPTPTPTELPPGAYLTRVTPKNIGENNWPAIAPDGKFVVFVTDATAVGRDGVDLYISVVGPDTIPKQLTTDGNARIESSPRFSPDGKRIAFSAGAEADATRRKNDIYLINSDGTGLALLVHADGVNNIRPVWSPDGKYIAFSSDRTGNMEVYVLNVETKETYQVTSGKDPFFVTDWAK
jgi:hypothetical protein